MSGYRSEQRIAPRAAEIVAGLLGDPAAPDWLRLPRFAPALAAYGRAQAIVDLLVAWLDAQGDVVAALTETTTAEETEERSKTRTRRRSQSQRTMAALAALDKAEARANSLRRELGLTPASAAKLGRDLAGARWFAGRTPLEDHLDRIEEQRQAAIEAGKDDGSGEWTRPNGTWSCVRDHRTTPCGDCDGCRQVGAENAARRGGDG